MLTIVLTYLSWLALPAGILAVVDDWFLRPRRRLAGTPDPALFALIEHVVPVLFLAALLRLLLSERLDFSVVLIGVVLVAGVVWALDHVWLAPARARAALAAGRAAEAEPLPVTVDYARSFFPVAVIVLLVRAFIFEPFRIPSDSMMPTLLDGDFIVVNKFAYGLKVPVLNTKLVDTGAPHRGDVVVFRWPPDPAINYIKRLVGLPGDRVQVINDQLIINGQAVPALEAAQRYDDGCYHNMRLATETLGSHVHQTLSCRTPDDLVAPVSSSCNRHLERNYLCEEPEGAVYPDKGDTPEIVVPPGRYLMIGDNRDNSSDGRYFGFVPEEYLIGRATRIWFNWDWQRAGGPIWSRIGHRID